MAADAAACCTAATAAAAGTHHQQQQQLLLAATERHVRAELAHHDASHDFSHIQRVRDTALRLARQEGLGEDALLVVELAALLHDIRDWKYDDGGEGAAGDAIRAFLAGQQGQPEALVRRVIDVVDAVGFKEELSCPGAAGARPPLSREAAVVQDADRLDAIGAIGIARCFTFGGSKRRVLYDPAVPPRQGLTKEAYMKEKSTTINHFPEKLLTLKGLMKTASGRRLAEQRHAFMEAYLAQFMAEVQGDA